MCLYTHTHQREHAAENSLLWALMGFRALALAGVLMLSLQEGQPIYLAVKGVVFDVTSGKGAFAASLLSALFSGSYSVTGF